VKGCRRKLAIKVLQSEIVSRPPIESLCSWKVPMWSDFVKQLCGKGKVKSLPKGAGLSF
jgi:hypothetical protein